MASALSYIRNLKIPSDLDCSESIGAKCIFQTGKLQSKSMQVSKDYYYLNGNQKEMGKGKGNATGLREGLHIYLFHRLTCMGSALQRLLRCSPICPCFIIELPFLNM